MLNPILSVSSAVKVGSFTSIDDAAREATDEEQERCRFGYFVNRHAGNCRAEVVIRMIEEESREDTNRSLHQEYMHGSLAL